MNKGQVLDAVRRNGLELRRYSEFLGDKDVALAAVEQNGMALPYVMSELYGDGTIDLTNDKDVVLTAVKQNGLALEYASEQLQNDRDVVKAAFQQNPAARQFAPPRLIQSIMDVRNFDDSGLSKIMPRYSDSRVKGYLGSSRKKKTKRRKRSTRRF